MTDETTIPDVSVVIPCYNAERWVGRAIDSVLAQEGVTVEVIVIDDGSTDGSVDVLRRYEDHIHWETGPNRGACAARNSGLKKTSGDFIKFLDADDYFFPGALQCQFKHAQSLDKKSFSFGRVMRHSEHDGRLAPHSTRDAREENQDTIFNMLIDPPVTAAMMYPRSLLIELGGFDERLAKRQDYDLFARALLLGYRAVACQAPIYAYTSHNSEFRISRRQDRATFANQVSMFHKQIELLGKSPASTHHNELRFGLATTIWITGRNCLRAGHKQEATQLFSLARTLAGHSAWYGHLLYKILVCWAGPIKAEMLIENIKRLRFGK